MVSCANHARRHCVRRGVAVTCTVICTVCSVQCVLFPRLLLIAPYRRPGVQRRHSQSVNMHLYQTTSCRYQSYGRRAAPCPESPTFRRVSSSRGQPWAVVACARDAALTRASRGPQRLVWLLRRRQPRGRRYSGTVSFMGRWISRGSHLSSAKLPNHRVARHVGPPLSPSYRLTRAPYQHV